MAEAAKWVKRKYNILSERKHLNLKEDFKIVLYRCGKGKLKGGGRKTIVSMRMVLRETDDEAWLGGRELWS